MAMQLRVAAVKRRTPCSNRSASVFHDGLNFDSHPRRSRSRDARKRAPTSGRYVSSIAGTVNGIQGPNYRYDADGNLICVYTGATCVGEEGVGAAHQEHDSFTVRAG